MAILAVRTGQPVRSFHTIQTRGTLRTNRANNTSRTINTVTPISTCRALRAALTGRTRHTLHTPLSTHSIHTQTRPVKPHRLLPTRSTHPLHTGSQTFSGCTIRLGPRLLRIPLRRQRSETQSTPGNHHQQHKRQEQQHQGSLLKIAALPLLLLQLPQPYSPPPSTVSFKNSGKSGRCIGSTPSGSLALNRRTSRRTPHVYSSIASTCADSLRKRFLDLDVTA